MRTALPGGKSLAKPGVAVAFRMRRPVFLPQQSQRHALALEFLRHPRPVRFAQVVRGPPDTPEQRSPQRRLVRVDRRQVARSILQALKLAHEPTADCARYDSLRRTNSHGTHRGSGTDGTLKLYGMRAAYDEIMGVAIKRQHEPPRIVGDLLQARSIKYQLTVAKLPLAKDIDDFDFAGIYPADSVNHGPDRQCSFAGTVATTSSALFTAGAPLPVTHPTSASVPSWALMNSFRLWTTNWCASATTYNCSST
jgi:hypothetical protein